MAVMRSLCLTIFYWNKIKPFLTSRRICRSYPLSCATFTPFKSCILWNFLSNSVSCWQKGFILCPTKPNWGPLKTTKISWNEDKLTSNLTHQHTRQLHTHHQCNHLYKYTCRRDASQCRLPIHDNRVSLMHIRQYLKFEINNEQIEKALASQKFRIMENYHFFKLLALPV